MKDTKKWVTIAVIAGIIYLLIKYALKVLKREPDTN